MPSHTRRGSTPTQRGNGISQSPNKIIRQDAFSTSAQSSPRRKTAEKGHKSRGPPEARTSFLDDDDDAQDNDPHDLEFSARHIPRASMVDNLVLSLDQLSPVQSTSRSHHNRPEDNKHRGHKVSTSISSETDTRHLAVKAPAVAATRSTGRNAAKYTKDPSKLPNIFGDEEDSVRARVYDAQRAAHPKPIKSRPHQEVEERKSTDTASSIDLRHLTKLQGKLGPAGNRRSQSFDFGSSRPHTLDIRQTTNTATSPTNLHSPETQISPVSATFQVPARRNSTKSTKNSYTIRGPPVTIGTTTLIRHQPPALSTANTVANLQDRDKMSPTTPVPESATASRSGIFKRFFGSSKNAHPVSASPTPYSAMNNEKATNDSTQKDTRPSTPPNRPHKLPAKSANDSNKENQQPTVVKKTSFFRRRKKSNGTNVPLPVPLTLSGNTNVNYSDQKSPVSSLKAFMDPYLTDETEKGTHPQQAPVHSSKTPADNVNDADDHTTTYDDKDGLLKLKPTATTSSDASKLAVPQRETFLADSSSAEDLKSDAKESNNHRSPSALSSTDRKAGVENGRSIGTISTIRQVSEDTLSNLQPSRPTYPLRNQSFTTTDSESNSLRHGRITTQLNVSGSDVSDYKSAPSTPALPDSREGKNLMSPHVHVSHPSISQDPNILELRKARAIYDNGEDLVDNTNAASWLGESGSERERIRRAYIDLFDFASQNIVHALRSLCTRLALKGESQLIDRILDAFAQRWCQCNPNHGFKSADVVHTICYSILLLNTDLHLADIGQKMTRSQFIKNAMQTIRPVAADAVNNPTVNGRLSVLRSNSYGGVGPDGSQNDKALRSSSALDQRPIDRLQRAESNDFESGLSMSGPLVDTPYQGSDSGWEIQVEQVLKEGYFSIQKDPLPLYGSESVPRLPPSATSNSLLGLSGLRRTPSTLSKATSENRGRINSETKSLGARWTAKARSRPRLGSSPGYGSSKTSVDDHSSAWSPSMSSTWSKVSLGKTLTSMSVDSFGTEGNRMGDYQSSIGFANALSQAIIRDDQVDGSVDDGLKAVPLLEDETLELEGAPWAKEGILKHKCHLEGVDKRSKDRNWNDCFAVIEKGWMRLFSFSVTAKSLRSKAKNQKTGGVVGGGNWQDNAEEVWKFMLRHTIASALPPPGYSKARPHVWALSLPTGAVHLFSVGTPDIVKEFVSTANFWSARLSKEPMIGGVSSMEYGWSDSVINRALVSSDTRPSFQTAGSPRPSTQLSLRSSVDHGTGTRPRLPGDKVYISEWTPPQQSLFASQLLEVDQLRALQIYVQNVEEDLQKHNELRAAMALTFTPKHINYVKAMNNWEKKSSYLLREIVKFRTYIDALQGAQATKEKIYKMRREEDEARMANDDAMALFNSFAMGATTMT